MSKIVAVIGATGQQGGSVIRALLSHPGYTLRGITRDVSKPAAQALASQGVQMVAADLEDKASLVQAFKGAHAVYAVTDYWVKMDAKAEIEQGKRLVDAAKENGVEHFIWSGLIDVKKATNGALSKVYHFDSKAAVSSYLASSGLNYTIYMPGFYMSNIPGQMLMKFPGADTYTFMAPIPEDAARFPLVDIAADTGKFVAGIVEAGPAAYGKEVYGAERYYTAREVLEAFEKAFPRDGKGVRYMQVPDEQYTKTLEGHGMPAFAAEELLQNMQLCQEKWGYYSGHSLDASHKLAGGKLTSLVEFFKKEPKFKDLQ